MSIFQKRTPILNCAQRLIFLRPSALPPLEKKLCCSLWVCEGPLPTIQEADVGDRQLPNEMPTNLPFGVPSSPLLPELSHAVIPGPSGSKSGCFLVLPRASWALYFLSTLNSTVHPFVPPLPHLYAWFFFSLLSLRGHPLKYHVSRCAGGSRRKMCVSKLPFKSGCLEGRLWYHLIPWKKTI